MSAFLPYIVAGIAAGSMYGLAGMGLVLTYRTTGIFNFAHGAVATAAAYFFIELWQRDRWPWPIAAVVAMTAVAVIGGLSLERIGRRLVKVPIALQIVATIGLVLGIEGVVNGIFGAPALQFPDFLPSNTVHLPGVYVGVDQIITVAFSLAIAVALYLIFRHTRLGVAMQAVVDDPDLLSLAGTSPVRVRALAWMMGLALAALAGILLGPSIGLDATLLTLLVVQAFGAAAVGRFRSLPLTYGGGLAVGILAALSTKYVVHLPTLGGLPSSLPFIFLFVVLVGAPRGLLVRGGTSLALGAPRRASAPVGRYGAYGVALAAAAAVPWVVGARLPLYSNAAVFVVVFSSLSLLVRLSGQVSLCHAALASIGAAAFSHLAHGVGLPWLLALFLAGLVAVPVGALIAIPAIRLSGLYLALATYGFGVLVERLLFHTRLMFGPSGGVPVPRPAGFGSDRAFYYVCVVMAVAACGVVVLVQRSRLGRLLAGLAYSPRALTALGTSVNVTRLLVFCISSFVVGVAGGLFGALTRSIDGTGFSDFTSLIWLALIFLAGKHLIGASVGAALLVAVVPDYLGSSTAVATWQPIVFGAGALLVALTATGRPRSAAEWLSRATDAAERRGRSGRVATRLSPLGTGSRSASEVAAR